MYTPICLLLPPNGEDAFAYEIELARKFPKDRRIVLWEHPHLPSLFLRLTVCEFKNSRWAKTPQTQIRNMHVFISGLPVRWHRRMPVYPKIKIDILSFYTKLNCRCGPDHPCLVQVKMRLTVAFYGIEALIGWWNFRYMMPATAMMHGQKSIFRCLYDPPI